MVATRSGHRTAKDDARGCAERRGYPTFLLPAEPPTWGSARALKSYRERIKDWNLQVTGEMNALPYVVYVNIAFKLFLYVYIFKNYVMNATEDVFSEENIKRFIIYNILGDVLGTNATSGPLGFRMKYFFVTWYNLISPGSITCPSFPASKRSVNFGRARLRRLPILFSICAAFTCLRIRSDCSYYCNVGSPYTI